jgi:hypothetical protein
VHCAGEADRDVDQIRSETRDFRQATTASFNALREDMTEPAGRASRVGAAAVQSGAARLTGWPVLPTW